MSELFSFLRLPNAKTFHKGVFPVCESKIGVSLRKIAKESMEEARVFEVRMHMESENKDYEEWRQSTNEKETSLLTWVGAKEARVTDMIPYQDMLLWLGACYYYCQRVSYLFLQRSTE